MGRLDGINCQLVQVSTTHLSQKHWEWQKEKPSDETRNSGKVDNVHGKLGHLDILR